MGEKTRSMGVASFLNDFSQVKYNLTVGKFNSPSIISHYKYSCIGVDFCTFNFASKD